MGYLTQFWHKLGFNFRASASINLVKGVVEKSLTRIIRRVIELMGHELVPGAVRGRCPARRT